MPARKKPPGLRVIRGGMAVTRPPPGAKKEYEVELRWDLDGNLHLFECESGAPVILIRSVQFTLPIEALKSEDDP